MNYLQQNFKVFRRNVNFCVIFLQTHQFELFLTELYDYSLYLLLFEKV